MAIKFNKHRRRHSQHNMFCCGDNVIYVKTIHTFNTFKMSIYIHEKFINIKLNINCLVNEENIILRISEGLIQPVVGAA